MQESTRVARAESTHVGVPPIPGPFFGAGAVCATQEADPNLNFGAGDPHPAGVGYATSSSDTEYVLNEDSASMPASTHYFNLLIFPS